jgi:hypothetical protein
MKTFKLKDLIKKYGTLRKALKARAQVSFLLCLTTADAALLLKDAVQNRRVTKVNVNKLVRLMHEGEWVDDPHNLLGPPIAFNFEGRLVNGSHRLSAQVVLGTVLTHMVVLGVSQKMINAMDAARQRSLEDQLMAFHDEPIIKKITRGVPTRARHLTTLTRNFYVSLVGEKSSNLRDTVQMAKFYEEALTWVIDVLSPDDAFKRASVMSATMLAYHWAKKHGRLTRFKDLTARTVKGENISGTALLLRNYVHALVSRKGKKSEIKESQWVVHIRCLRAYQAILTDEPMSVLPYVDDCAGLRAWFMGCSPRAHAKHLGVGCMRDVMKEVRIRKNGKNIVQLVRAMEVAA